MFLSLVVSSVLVILDLSTLVVLVPESSRLLLSTADLEHVASFPCSTGGLFGANTGGGLFGANTGGRPLRRQHRRRPLRRQHWRWFVREHRRWPIWSEHRWRPLWRQHWRRPLWCQYWWRTLWSDYRRRPLRRQHWRRSVREHRRRPLWSTHRQGTKVHRFEQFLSKRTFSSIAIAVAVLLQRVPRCELLWARLTCVLLCSWG